MPLSLFRVDYVAFVYYCPYIDVNASGDSVVRYWYLNAENIQHCINNKEQWNLMHSR